MILIAKSIGTYRHLELREIGAHNHLQILNVRPLRVTRKAQAVLATDCHPPAHPLSCPPTCPPPATTLHPSLDRVREYSPTVELFFSPKHQRQQRPTSSQLTCLVCCSPQVSHRNRLASTTHHTTTHVNTHRSISDRTCLLKNCPDFTPLSTNQQCQLKRTASRRSRTR
jgi:hypothetical protein